MAVTIIDIAREVGKSYPTVSRALNNHPRISQETRKLVQDAAKKLGYHPSYAGRSLSRRKTMVIRCIIADLSNPFNAEFALAVRSCCSKRGYDLIITDYGYDPKVESHQYECVLGGDCDGVIGQVTEFSHLDRIFRQINANKLPAVILGGAPGIEKFTVGTVASDVGMRQVDYLYERGHREIVLAVGGHTEDVTRYICNMFRDKCAELGLSFDFSRNVCAEVGRVDSLPDSGYRCGKRIASEHPQATAVVAVNDIVALGIMRALREAKLRIPEDISLIGQDNIWPGRFSDPALTTYDLNTSELAEAAVNLVLDKELKQHSKKVFIPGTLVVRESVGAPR